MHNAGPPLISLPVTAWYHCMCVCVCARVSVHVCVCECSCRRKRQGGAWEGARRSPGCSSRRFSSLSLLPLSDNSSVIQARGWDGQRHAGDEAPWPLEIHFHPAFISFPFKAQFCKNPSARLPRRHWLITGAAMFGLGEPRYARPRNYKEWKNSFRQTSQGFFSSFFWCCHSWSVTAEWRDEGEEVIEMRGRDIWSMLFPFFLPPFPSTLT